MPIHDFSKKKKTVCHVNFGILPCIKTASLGPDAHMEMNADIDMLRQRKSPAKSQKKVVRKHQLHYWRSLHSWVVYLKILIQESLFCVKKENLGSKRRRQNLQWHLAPNKNSGKKGSIARDYPKVWTSWAWSLLAKIRGKITWGDFATRKMHPQSSVGFGEHIFKLKNADKATFYTPIEAREMQKTRGARTAVDSGASMHMMSKTRLKLRWIGYFAKIQEPHCDAHSQWWRAYKRGSTNFRSQFGSIRDCAVTRGNASSPITGKTLRRPRILLWVGQRSKTTVDQRGGDNWMQNGQLRTSCRSRVIQIWERFAGNIDTAGLVVNKSSSVAKWRTSPTKVVRINLPKTKTKMDDKKDADDPLADLPILLEDFTDNLEATEVHAPAHMSHYSDSERPTKVVSKSRKHSTCTHFQRPKLRSLLANQNDQSSSQNSHWRSSTSSIKVWWLDNGWWQGPQWGG